eukprot:3273450-Rhodomonas_salina.3
MTGNGLVTRVGRKGQGGSGGRRQARRSRAAAVPGAPARVRTGHGTASTLRDKKKQSEGGYVGDGGHHGGSRAGVGPVRVKAMSAPDTA